jgi:hypothetical protein
MPVYVKYRHKNAVARTAVCDGKIFLKLAYREFGLRHTRITSSRLKNGHQSAPAYEAVRLISYQYVRCVFWHYTRDRPSANIIYMICSLYGDHLIQKSLSWEDKKTTKDIRQYRQQTPPSGAVFTHVLKQKEHVFMYTFVFFFVALRPNGGHGLLILEVSWSHTTTHNSRQDSSGRVINSSQRPLPDNTQHWQQANAHALGGIRIHDLSRRAAADLRLRTRGHWDRQTFVILCDIMLCDIILQKCKCFGILFYILKWMKKNFQIMQMACFYMKCCTLNDKSNITVDWHN